jgi:hypothetical protein
MSLGRRIINTGAGDAVCNTESVQAFGADSTYSSNIALYQLDSDGGTTNNVPDTTTNYNGIASNVTYAAGKYNNAAVFNGSNSKIDTGISSISSPFSVSMWINEDSLDSGMFFANWNSTSADMYWQTTSDGRLRIAIDGYSEQFFGTAGDVTVNTWHHVAVTLGSGVYEVYLDGVSLGTSTTSVTTFSSGQNFMIGNSAKPSSPYPFDGLIDQVRIFNKAISAEDVVTLSAETSSTLSNTNPFSEGAGLALYSMDYDASDAGGYYDGTPSNVIFGVGGQINTAARLDGSAVAADIVLGSSFISAFDVANKSFSLWFKWDGSNPGSNGYGMPFFMNGTGLSNGRIGVQITNSNGTITAYSGTAGSNPTSTISANTWYHFALVVSGSSYKAFLNGSSIGTATNNNGVDSGTQTASIGSWFSSNYYFCGDIDQVRFFSKSLSDDEVNTLWNNGNGEIACVHTATANTADYPSGTTTVAHYPLDNNTFDNKSTNDATYETNIEYRFGKYGQATVFNGSSSQIITGYKPPATTTATISLWVNWKAYTNAYAVLAADNNTGTTANSFLTLATGGSGYGGNGYLWVSIGNGSSADTDTSIAFDDHGGLGNWIHVAVTVSGTSVNIYMNGYKAKTYTSTVSYAPSGSGYAYRLGYTSGWGYFDGKLDQVRFYSTELSSNQILELYNEKPEVDTSNFKAVLYDGASSYVSNVGFQPDLLWVKGRTFSSNNRLFDSVRGASAGSLSSNQQSGNATASGQRINSFEANGFIAPSENGDVNQSGQDFVAWCWKGSNADAVNIGVNSITGSTPSIASDVSANTAAGFSIVKYTGNLTSGTTATGQSVAHGLDNAPDLIIFKSTSNSSDWNVFSSQLSNWSTRLKLNESDDKDNLYSTYPIDDPTSDVFYTNYLSAVNVNNYNHIAYCWHSVAGYSRISIYEGDGTTNNKIYTTDDGTSTGSNGFKPSFVMLKNIDRTNTRWIIMDTARDPVNTAYHTLTPNSSYFDNDSQSYWLMDFESDGFRLKYGADNEFNKLGDTFIFMAFK